MISLNELGEDGKPIIDLVVVIMDSSSKDMGTSYDLINNVLIPCLGKEAHKRIIIGLNQADIAMKGNHWNKAENKPDDVLNAFLKKKAASVRARIKEGTGLDIEPICYCAGYSEEGEEQCKPYNLTKLLHSIIQIIPREKRLVLVDNLNTNKENWKHDDEEEDYGEETEYVVIDTVFDYIEDGSELGGKILGIPGKLVGGVAGAIVGTVAGVFKSIFG